MFFKKKCLFSIPIPQTPFPPGKGLYYWGYPPLDPVGGYAPATPFYQKVQTKCVKLINKSAVYSEYLTCDEACKARYTAAFATSSGVPSLPSGVSAISSFISSGDR